MARTNIQVVITVKDGATKPLENVQKTIRGTGKAARDSTADIWQFNKTLFSTFAFVGLFTKGFSKLKESLMIGAELDKVSTQFERQVGPKSKFISALEGSTNVVIDEMTALDSGLKLSNLGITHGLENTAETIAKFAVAGRMAGKDATDVIEGLTGAVTEGNVARLEELGIMKRSDPAFMALQAITAKAGGTMGGVIAKQQAMAIVMGAINKRVQGQMFAFMSLGEVIDYTGKAYNNLRRNIGILLGNAVRPLLEKLLPLIQNFNKIVDSISRTDKETLFLVKTVLALTAALAGLFATLGSLKLIVKLLGFTPLGFSGMSMAILAVTAAFVGLTRAADGPLAKLKLFGAFFKGIYELVTNFDPETGMSKISAATEKLLADNGILGFVDFIAASIVTVKTAIKDIVDFVNWGARKVDAIVGFIFGGIDDRLKKTQKWTTWWTTNTLSNFDKIKRAALLLGGIIGTIFLGKKLFGAAGGILSKLPVIGGMFGGRGPKGTPTDPIYTASVGGAIGNALKNTTFGSGAINLVKNLFSQLSVVLEYLVSYGFAGLRYALSESLMPILRTFGSVFSKIIAPIVVFGSAIWGAIEGIIIVADEYKKFFIGLSDATGAIVTMASDLFMSIPYVKDFIDGIKTAADWLYTGAKFLLVDGPLWIIKNIAEGFKIIFGTLGIQLGSFGKSMSDWAAAQSKGKLSTPPEKKQTSVSVPTTPTYDDESTIQVLGEQMKNMDQAGKEKMQQAIESAMRSPANGGGFIDPEEFSTFQRMLTDAFDGSKNLQELVREAKDKKTSMRASQRG
jgi:hypothetical protein